MRTMVIASVALAVAGLAGVPAAAGQSPGTDSVTGTASECVESIEIVPGQIICVRMLRLDVDVESGPAGENAAGTVFLSSFGTTPGGSASVPSSATCLSVNGRVAIIGVTGSWRPGGLESRPIAGLLRVADAGGPASRADVIQFAYQSGEPLDPPLPGPTTCSTFPGTFTTTDSFFFPNFTNETGDIVVTDARPFPTTKDQCKNGGWKSYGVFKNQGDCVSFVATRGKNPPGKTG
jgi:hypothetical protein